MRRPAWMAMSAAQPMWTRSMWWRPGRGAPRAAAAGMEGHAGGPAHVDVDHDVDVRAQRFAHAADIVHVGAPVADMGDLLLERLVALGHEMLCLGDHPVAARAAEAAATIDRDLTAVMAPEPVEWQAGSAADHVPQRNVDGRLRHHCHPTATAGQGEAPQI